MANEGPWTLHHSSSSSYHKRSTGQENGSLTKWSPLSPAGANYSCHTVFQRLLCEKGKREATSPYHVCVEAGGITEMFRERFFPFHHFYHVGSIAEALPVGVH